MILIEQGWLHLDQPVSDILPDFRDMRVIVGGDVTQTRPASGPILIRNLLTHTSGLSYNINGDSPLARLYRQQGIKPASRATAPGPGERPPVRNLEDFGARLSKLPLDFDPGTRWQYSVAADLMGLVIQRVSRMSFWDFLRTRIFGPLGMPDTDFMVPPDKLDRLTTVYTRTPTGLVDSDDRKSSPYARDRDLPSGGGGLVSTARDYARFNAMLLNEGELDGARILKPETVRIARSNLMPPGPVFGLLGRPNGFGAFMQVVLPGGELPGAEPAGSYGWSGAAGTTMWIDPVNQVSVVLMVQFMPAGSLSDLPGEPRGGLSGPEGAWRLGDQLEKSRASMTDQPNAPAALSAAQDRRHDARPAPRRRGDRVGTTRRLGRPVPDLVAEPGPGRPAAEGGRIPAVLQRRAPATERTGHIDHRARLGRPV